MSQARRSRVLARERARRQVARLLVREGVPLSRSATPMTVDDDGSFVPATGQAAGNAAVSANSHALLVGRVTFDVHAARELGERLVAFERYAGADDVAADWRADKRHRTCPRCEGAGIIGSPEEALAAALSGGPREFALVAEAGGVAVACSWCEGRGRLSMSLPPDFPHDALRWRQHVRLGRRLLAALEGQPSECQTCDGGGLQCHSWGAWMATRQFEAGPASINCPDCNGTGHNLRGYLPPVEWPAVVRRKVADSYAQGHRQDSWVDRLFPDGVAFGAYTHGPPHGRQGPWVLRAHGRPDWREDQGLPRSVPRGDHCEVEMRAVGPSRLRDVELVDGSVMAWIPLSTLRGRGLLGSSANHLTLVPRWRRGELKHDRQRRERERRRETVVEGEPPIVQAMRDVGEALRPGFEELVRSFGAAIDGVGDALSPSAPDESTAP